MQIYFDFSGYSDMAVGMARMFGFHFLENFNFPYISKNITEFWRRWHISLSTWLREYIYFPLGGNRGSKLRTYVNLIIVFFISGLWHGANYNFVLWGLFHGFFIVTDKAFWLKFSKKIPGSINILITFIIINLGWVLFRLENIPSALNYYARLFSFNNFFSSERYIIPGEIFSYKSIFVLIVALIISTLPGTELYKRFKTHFVNITRNKLQFEPVSIIALFVLSIFSLANSGFNPFIYFRF
jgi:alginate O-acetyltransferase complex protein AlgI